MIRPIRNIFLLLLTTTLLSSCWNSDIDVCKTQLMKRLVNPETLEVFDIKEFEAEEGQSWYIANTDSSKMKDLSSMAKHIAPLIAIRKIIEENKDAKYFGFRFKSDSKMGLKITQHAWCAVDDNLQDGAAVLVLGVD